MHLTTIGPYRIVELIGAGGMGEVYRATDTNLKRAVAIKVLPVSVSSDPERLARFQREAEVLAALNHPNIAGIYGLEETSGTRALVMELVEGEDLSQRIERGPIPLDDALSMARQIADALEAAHEQGIIHRDLKPSNVKVREDGTVKVLDFGLARTVATRTAGATDAAGAVRAEPLNSPTITSPAALTMGGMILGTAAYMSPEQAKGRSIDKRADLWAFGCVLYEMLTGRRAFQGEDVSDTLAAILRGEPDWSALPPATPPAVTALLKRCLERDARRRVADASTLRFVLDERGLFSLTGAVAPHPDQAPLRSHIDSQVAGARRQLLMRRVVPLAAALMIAVLTIAVMGWRLGTPTGPAPVMKFAVTPEDGQVIASRSPLAISPDGSHLAYIANGQLYVRAFSEFEPRVIQATGLGQPIASPAFSPDGQSIAVHSISDQALKRIDLRGGPALRLCETPSTPVGVTWDTSGILMGLGASGVVRCSPSGGAQETLVKMQDGELAGHASLLPEGDGLLFSVAKVSDGDNRADNAAIVVQSLRTGARKHLVSGGSDPRFLGSGHLLYTAGGVVFAVAFDPATQERRGDPVPVIEGIRRSIGTAALAISATGVAAYIPGPTGATGATTLGVADRTGVVTRLPMAEGAYTHVRASRDGQTLAIGTEDEAQAIIWTYPLSGSAAMQRLTLEGRNRFPLWSPDGVSVAFESDRDGQPGLYRQRADGTGGVERLTSAPAGETHIPESWSPDGRYLSFAVRKSEGYSLWTLSLATKRAEQFAGVVSREPPNSSISPDGKWIAYVRSPSSDLQSSERGVFVRPFPAGGSVYQAPRQLVDFHPVWTADGRELIYVASAAAGQMAAVRVTAGGGMTFGAPARFPASVTGDRVPLRFVRTTSCPTGASWTWWGRPRAAALSRRSASSSTGPKS
ncbi:MAG: protein kinase domain-containing protein [Acidobacteriota bacterium]